MDLRAGSPAAERRTGSRSLRRTILAGPASSFAHDDGCLRFPPVSPAQNSKTGKKESTGRRLNPPCPPCARPFSNSSTAHHRTDVRTAENGFATNNGVSKSAKVVLGRVLIKPGLMSASIQKRPRYRVAAKSRDVPIVRYFGVAGNLSSSQSKTAA